MSASGLALIRAAVTSVAVACAAVACLAVACAASPCAAQTSATSEPTTPEPTTPEPTTSEPTTPEPTTPEPTTPEPTTPEPTSPEPTASEPTSPEDGASLIARGRSLGWGVDAIVPIYLGDVRQRDGTPVRYLNPGGGVEARLFYELAGGIGLGVSGGVMVHASESTRALTSYRGAAEVRWVIDVGSLELAPVVALSIGVLIAQVAEETVVTGYARVLASLQWILAPWVALEGGVSLEGAIGADAFPEAIAWLSPRIGVTFHE